MTFEELMSEFSAAGEAGDGKRFGAIFTEDGLYHDTFYGEFTGREGIADMLENRFWRDAKDFRWVLRHPVSDGQNGYAEWTFSYTTVMAQNAGTRVVFEGMSRFELRGGLIAKYSEVFDGGIALSQLGFPPDKLARILGKWAEEKRALPRAAEHLKG